VRVEGRYSQLLYDGAAKIIAFFNNPSADIVYLFTTFEAVGGQNNYEIIYIPSLLYGGRFAQYWALTKHLASLLR